MLTTTTTTTTTLFELAETTTFFSQSVQTARILEILTSPFFFLPPNHQKKEKNNAENEESSFRVRLMNLVSTTLKIEEKKKTSQATMTSPRVAVIVHPDSQFLCLPTRALPPHKMVQWAYYCCAMSKECPVLPQHYRQPRTTRIIQHKFFVSNNFVRLTSESWLMYPVSVLNAGTRFRGEAPSQAPHNIHLNVTKERADVMQ